MTRAELEHILRVAVAVTGRREWVVVGSQAILGACPDAAAELLVSQEADIYSPEDEQASDLIDGTIGERSPFHETFGYYAHGVGPKTAVLPPRWQRRAVRVEGPDTGGAVGLCPDPADLTISKLVAWREKDREFVQAILRHGIASIDDVRLRAAELPDELARDVNARLERLTPR